MKGRDIIRIKLVLVEKKRTAKWLSEELVISPVTLSKLCSNTTQPSLKILDKIADILEIDIRELVNGRNKQ